MSGLSFLILTPKIFYQITALPPAASKQPYPLRTVEFQLLNRLRYGLHGLQFSSSFANRAARLSSICLLLCGTRAAQPPHLDPERAFAAHRQLCPLHDELCRKVYRVSNL
ncbi:hypothetical protein E4U59_002517 [Claviceps monticola]|nr:hypothetical protein E4U59_002517 [Claviceps monticola]